MANPPSYNFIDSSFLRAAYGECYRNIQNQRGDQAGSVQTKQDHIPEQQPSLSTFEEMNAAYKSGNLVKAKTLAEEILNHPSRYTPKEREEAQYLLDNAKRWHAVCVEASNHVKSNDYRSALSSVESYCDQFPNDAKIHSLKSFCETAVSLHDQISKAYQQKNYAEAMRLARIYKNNYGLTSEVLEIYNNCQLLTSGFIPRKSS